MLVAEVDSASKSDMTVNRGITYEGNDLRNLREKRNYRDKSPAIKPFIVVASCRVAISGGRLSLKVASSSRSAPVLHLRLYN